MGLPESELLLGTVMAVQANYYQVYLHAATDALAPKDNLPRATPSVLPTRMLLCTRRSRLKKIGQRVLVGDLVWVEEPDWQGGRGAIAKILPRHSELTRPPIANIDQIILVFALADPRLDPYQLSRFLVMAEMTGMAIQLCLSKADLVSAADQQDWQTQLQDWGYAPLPISTTTGQGLAEFQALLAGHTTVLTGPSGVGKSSLVNTLIPALNLRVGGVSTKLKRGRHTTRHVELFELPLGGFLADTPGFNLPDLETCPPTSLGSYFPEINRLQATNPCQFNNCLHRNEPNCGVRGHWDRYTHYLEFLSLVEQQLPYLESHESAVKTKVRASGQLHHEPRLAYKKYRRSSRRSRHQDLQSLCQEIE